MTDGDNTTRLLHRMAGGDSSAAAELLPILYQQLHELARSYMAGENRQHTLQPTALIHEAWLRMQRDQTPQWQNRSHFIGVAAKAMRRVLMDHARRRDAQKRSGGLERLPFDAALDLYEKDGPQLIELDEALERLDAIDPQLVKIVELRFFAGASNDDIASALDVSTRTVERGWKTAQAWLRAEIDPGPARL